jgi:hypothetical protein
MESNGIGGKEEPLPPSSSSFDVMLMTNGSISILLDFHHLSER